MISTITMLNFLHKETWILIALSFSFLCFTPVYPTALLSPYTDTHSVHPYPPWFQLSSAWLLMVLVMSLPALFLLFFQELLLDSVFFFWLAHVIRFHYLHTEFCLCQALVDWVGCTHWQPRSDPCFTTKLAFACQLSCILVLILSVITSTHEKTNGKHPHFESEFVKL